MGLPGWNYANLCSVCGVEGCSTVSHPKFPTFAESALSLLKHRKLDFITQEAFIKMLGNQPNLPLEARGMFNRKKERQRAQKDWTRLLCCEELKCCTLPKQQHTVYCLCESSMSDLKLNQDITGIQTTGNGKQPWKQFQTTMVKQPKDLTGSKQRLTQI